MMKPVSEQLFNYLQNAVYDPANASINIEDLPEEFREFGRGLQYYVGCVAETQNLALSISKGDLNAKLPTPGNEIAAPLKALHASLKHLTWQSQQIEQGDYSQRVEFMGEFADSFNAMTEQLSLRRENERKERERLQQYIDAQRKSERARELAEESTKAKSSFLANMSHEIRTPMNAILGVTEIILQNDDLPDDIEAGLEKIYNSCTLLLGIINDILDFSKIEAGKLDIMPSEYKIADLINDSVQLNMMRIGSKAIKFELQIDENIPAKLTGDELRIKQILNNLLSNAFKYTESGTVTLTVSSEHKPLSAAMPLSEQVPESEVLVMSVSDTGQGMTKAQLSRLFTEYSRFNRDSYKNIEGTGLGLTITQRLINLMDGEITVDSKPRAGSIFTVRLPQEKVDDEVLGIELASSLRQFRVDELMQKGRHHIEREPMPYGKVLVVDDVETNLYVASGLLNTYSLQVDTTMSGREALAMIKGGKEYDVVFMDHMMPEMDGIEAVNHLRKSGYTAPVVALTANAVTGQKDMFLSNGFDDFISKPIDIHQFDFILNKYVRKEQRSERQEQPCAPQIVPQIVPNTQKKENTLLIESFIRDGRRALAVLDELCHKKKYAKEECLKRFIITVHGMKVSLSSIGETELSKMAEKMEMAGRAQDSRYIKSSMPVFMEGLRELLERIEPIKEEHTENEDVKVIYDTLLTLQELCADYNRKGALELLSGLKHCTKETRTFLNNINNYILNSDYEEAETAAAAYIFKLQMSA